MNAGAYNRRVTLWRAISADAESGGQDLTWSPIGACWVNAVPVGGSEALSSGMLQSNESWRLTMHHRDLRVSDRIRMGERTLDIVSAADPDGRREVIVCMCALLHGEVDS